PPDLLALHDTHGILDILAVAAIDDAVGRGVLGLHLSWILATGHAPNTRVAVGDHADQRAVLGIRDGADIELFHLFGDRAHRGLRRNAFDAFIRHVFQSRNPSVVFDLWTTRREWHPSAKAF